MIYLDHAASSHPKPPAIADAVYRCLTETGANPGRSGHRLSLDAARLLFDARESAAALLNIGDSRQIILSPGATFGLNTALFGFLKPGAHVLVLGPQHNATARALHAAVTRLCVRISRVAADDKGRISPAAVRSAVERDTALAVVVHACNVTGVANSLDKIKEALGGVPLLADAAQSVGSLPIDVEADGIDMLAFSGHKSLFGPQGTGGLYLRPGLALAPLVLGGTGSYSEFDSQPEFLPDRLEAGTPNTPGIAGLAEGIRFVLSHGVAAIHEKETTLRAHFLESARSIPGIAFHGADSPGPRTATTSFTLKNCSPSEIGRLLDRRYNICCRVGLHCAPEVHRALGTFPHGTVRISPSFLNSPDDVRVTADAIREIASQ